MPFEATPGGGPNSRSESNFEADQIAAQLQETEFDRLTEQLESEDPGTAEAARSALESLGADIYETETGGRVIRDPGSRRIAFPPGTTTEQHPGGKGDFAVFSVAGAKRTEYLMTATGDVYEDGQWQQLDPVFVDNNPSAQLPSWCAKTWNGVARPGTPCPIRVSSIFFLPLILTTMTMCFWTGIRVGALTSDGWIPAGVVPVSRHLNLMEREGVYSPYSGIFSMNEPAHGYQWWSIVPRLSRDDLFRAEVVDDPTYLQLPADMPRRIRELAEDHNGRGELRMQRQRHWSAT